jgi:hypothetical protein
MPFSDSGDPNEVINGHYVNSDECWCNPDTYQLCPICGGDSKGCELCLKQDDLPVHPGLVPAYDPEQSSIIVHQDL